MYDVYAVCCTVVCSLGQLPRPVKRLAIAYCMNMSTMMIPDDHFEFDAVAALFSSLISHSCSVINMHHRTLNAER